MSDSEFYNIAQQEITNSTYDKDLWRKALTLMGENEEKAKEKYIKLRIQQLQYSEGKPTLNNRDIPKVNKIRTITDIERMTEEEKRARYGKK